MAERGREGQYVSVVPEEQTNSLINYKVVVTTTIRTLYLKSMCFEDF